MFIADPFTQMKSTLYTSLPPPPPKGEIVFSGFILSDGRGDFVHMVSLAKKIHRLFPKYTLRLLVISAKNHRNSHFEEPIKGITHIDIAYHDVDFLCSPIIKKSPFPFDVFSIIKKASLWISGPVGIRGLFDPIIEKVKHKGIAFTEYNENYNWDTLRFSKKISLGLSSSKLGIFTHKCKSYTYENLQSETLKSFLFGDSNESAQKYEKTHTLFFCYQKDPHLFILWALSYNDTCHPDRAVDITLFNDPDTLEFKNTAYYCFLDIGVIRLITFEKGTFKEHKTLSLGSSKKELRFLFPGPLSKRDFKVLMMLSSPLVGCTGDHSLAQALSFGKIPFYDGRKRPLTKALVDTIESLYGKTALWDLVNPAGRDIDIIRNRAALQKAMEQAKDFSTVVHAQFSFNSKIKGIVNESLHLAFYPKLQSAQSALYIQWVRNSLSLEDAKMKLQKNLIPSSSSCVLM